MSMTSVRTLRGMLLDASKCVGVDASIRQLHMLLLIAEAGPEGVDGVTVERMSESSQAATSRTLKLLAVEKQLIEFFLDPADGRRRLARLSPKGLALVRKFDERVDRYGLTLI